MSEVRETSRNRRALRPLREMWPYVRRYRGRVAAALVFLTLAALTTLTLPIAVRRMIDHGFSSADSTFIANYFVMLIGVAALLALASACRYYFVVSLGERVVTDLRRDVFAHVMSLSPAFFDRSQSGEIVSRLTADAAQVRSAVSVTVSTALRNVLMGLGAVAMMIVTSPKLSSLVLLAIPVIVLPLVAFGRSVRARSREAQDTLAKANAYASEQIAAVRTVQSFTNEKMVSGNFAAAIERAYVAACASMLARAILTFVVIFTVFASVVAVLWFGSRDVLSGVMSPGILGQFLLYSVLAAGALGALSEVWGELNQAAGAAERLTELLAERPGIAAPAHADALPTPPKGTIDFDNVSFSYSNNANRSAVHGVSFAVKAGETVAIVGPSGAGKTSVFALLQRQYDVQSGRIAVDNVDVGAVDPQELRRRIAIVPQDTMIFAASIRDNIGFGRPGATDAEIEAAARSAHAHEFIARLPDGYATEAGERGVILSGGQRQRIAIARAILRDAPILLLDEATSALDAESEQLVQSALEELMQKRTTLVIAHRLATVLKADRILVMDHGRIVEQGTHAALVKKDGLYARLARMQFDSGAEAFQTAE